MEYVLHAPWHALETNLFCVHISICTQNQHMHAKQIYIHACLEGAKGGARNERETETYNVDEERLYICAHHGAVDRRLHVYNVEHRAVLAQSKFFSRKRLGVHDDVQKLLVAVAEKLKKH